MVAEPQPTRIRSSEVPLTIGVYEPVQLRWALAYEAAGRLPTGSMVKLYFGGTRSLFNIGRPALNFGLPPIPQSLDMYLTMMDGSVRFVSNSIDLQVWWSVGTKAEGEVIGEF